MWFDGNVDLVKAYVEDEQIAKEPIMAKGSRLKHKIMLYVDQLSEEGNNLRAAELFKRVGEIHTKMVTQKMSAERYVVLLKDILAEMAFDGNKREIDIVTQKEDKEKAYVFARKESKEEVDQARGAVPRKEINVFTNRESKKERNDVGHAGAADQVEASQLIKKTIAEVAKVEQPVVKESLVQAKKMSQSLVHEVTVGEDCATVGVREDSNVGSQDGEEVKSDVVLEAPREEILEVEEVVEKMEKAAAVKEKFKKIPTAKAVKVVRVAANRKEFGNVITNQKPIGVAKRKPDEKYREPPGEEVLEEEDCVIAPNYGGYSYRGLILRRRHIEKQRRDNFFTVAQEVEAGLDWSWASQWLDEVDEEKVFWNVVDENGNIVGRIPRTDDISLGQEIVSPKGRLLGIVEEISEDGIHLVSKEWIKKGSWLYKTIFSYGRSIEVIRPRYDAKKQKVTQVLLKSVGEKNERQKLAREIRRELQARGWK